MDLGAYAQIDDLERIANANNIKIPRLRGYRLMSQEDPIHNATLKQWKTFNKYVGREDVLMIHSRIGGNNWNFYGGPELEKEPWFLERVDDSYDSTYCDIYAKIKKGG